MPPVFASLYSTFCQVLPPSVVRKMPRSSLSANGCPKRSDECDVRILRIDDHASDGMRVRQADELPRLAGVDRFINSVAADDVAADAGFARPDINDVRIRLRNGDRADRRRHAFRLVGQRLPVQSAIGGLPHAAGSSAHVIHVGLTHDARDRGNASAAKRADQPVLQAFPRTFVLALVLLGLGRLCRGSRCRLLRLRTLGFGVGFLIGLLRQRRRKGKCNEKGDCSRSQGRYLRRESSTISSSPVLQERETKMHHIRNTAPASRELRLSRREHPLAMAFCRNHGLTPR